MIISFPVTYVRCCSLCNTLRERRYSTAYTCHSSLLPVVDGMKAVNEMRPVLLDSIHLSPSCTSSFPLLSYIHCELCPPSSPISFHHKIPMEQMLHLVYNLPIRNRPRYQRSEIRINIRRYLLFLTPFFFDKYINYFYNSRFLSSHIFIYRYCTTSSHMSGWVRMKLEVTLPYALRQLKRNYIYVFTNNT